MRQLTVFINLFLLLPLVGCSNGIKSSQGPDWIDNPGTNIVGKCGTHVRGHIAQEQCAYKKGLVYIAMSKGVSVDVSANMTMKQTATEKTGNSYGQVQANVKIDEKNIIISASIIDKWHDQSSDIMYVLIEEK